jgi:hypothetical protein
MIEEYIGRFGVSLALLVLLGLWLAAVGSSLLMARDRLSKEYPTLRDEVLVRGVAFVGSSAVLASFGAAATILTTTKLAISLVPWAWVLSITPLFIPPIRWKNGQVLVSSETWVLVSVLLTVGSGVFLAFSILVRLLLTNPQLVHFNLHAS